MTHDINMKPQIFLFSPNLCCSCLPVMHFSKAESATAGKKRHNICLNYLSENQCNCAPFSCFLLLVATMGQGGLMPRWQLLKHANMGIYGHFSNLFFFPPVGPLKMYFLYNRSSISYLYNANVCLKQTVTIHQHIPAS